MRTADISQGNGVGFLVDDLGAMNTAITRLYYYGVFTLTTPSAGQDWNLIRPSGAAPSHARAAYYQYWCRTNPGTSCPSSNAYPADYPNGDTSGPAP